jgi:hypothetical protein
LSTPTQRHQLRQPGVQATRPKTVQIQCDFAKPQCPQTLGNLLSLRIAGSDCDVLSGQLNSCQIILFQANSQLATLQYLTQKGLGQINSLRSLCSDFHAIGDSAGETGGGRFVG